MQLLDVVRARSGPQPASTQHAPTVEGGTRSIATARLNPSVAAEAVVPGTQTDAVVRALAALIPVAHETAAQARAEQTHGTAAPGRLAASSHHAIRSPNARVRLRCRRVGSCRSLARPERLARQTSPRIHQPPRRSPWSHPRDFRLRRGHHRRVDRAGVHDGCGVHRCVPDAHRPGHCRCLRRLRCDCRCHPVANHPQAGPGRLDRSCHLRAGPHPRGVRRG